MYLQAEPGDSNLDLASAMEFINTLGYTSAFQQLRTREQLGYMVYTQLERGPSGKVSPPLRDGSGGGGANGEGMHPGGPLAWSVVVQSSDKTPAELEERVEAWIAAFREELADLSDEVFESTVASMVSIDTVPCLNQGREAEAGWPARFCSGREQCRKELSGGGMQEGRRAGLGWQAGIESTEPLTAPCRHAPPRDCFSLSRCLAWSD